MTGTVRPIRPGIEPEFDSERELIDFVRERVREFCGDHDAPRSIAFVVTSGQRAVAHSWTMETDVSRGECCGYAAALLMERAVGR